MRYHRVPGNYLQHATYVRTYHVDGLYDLSEHHVGWMAHGAVVLVLLVVIVAVAAAAAVAAWYIVCICSNFRSLDAAVVSKRERETFSMSGIAG